MSGAEGTYGVFDKLFVFTYSQYYERDVSVDENEKLIESAGSNINMMLIAELKVFVEVDAEFDEKFFPQPLNQDCFFIEVFVRRRDLLAILTSSGRFLRFHRK